MTTVLKVLRSTGPRLVPFVKSIVVYFVISAPNDSPSLFAALIKVAPIFSLELFVLLYGVTREVEYTYARRILAGLIMSGVGDVLLVWPSLFVPGMAMFGLAQIAYISAFGWKPELMRLGYAVYAVTLLTVFQLVLSAPGVLKVLIPVYGLLLGTTLWRALARLALGRQRFLWTEASAALGATLFAISDTILSFNLFHAPIANAQVLVMTTYYLAQLGITLSVVGSEEVYRISHQISGIPTALADKEVHSATSDQKTAEQANKPSLETSSFGSLHRRLQPAR